MGDANKTRFWYLLGVLSAFSTSTPFPFRREYPPSRVEVYRLIKLLGSLPAAAFLSDRRQQVVDFLHHWGMVWLKLLGKLRNGKRAACNHGVMDTRGRLLSTKEA